MSQSFPVRKTKAQVKEVLQAKMQAARALSWAAVLLCGGALVLTDSRVYGDDLPHWDDRSTLATGYPYVTGHYLASKPGGIHLARQSFEAIDLFALDEASARSVTNKLLCGKCPLRPQLFAHARGHEVQSAT